MESDLPANATAVVSALFTYERQILPLVRKEMDRWGERASAIPDPLLRAAAVDALRDKGRNVEATAIFGILVARARRAGPVRAMTALQAAIDYLDSLSEQPVDDPLADGLALHEALVDAVSPGAEAGDWYRLHPQREDGGYLAALVASCREQLALLPATRDVLPFLQRAARRCGEGQSHTHAAARASAAQLEAWATEQPQPSGYLWWEVAAGASSSVAAHALIAAAADPRTTAAEAALVDATYFPAVGALTVLLDDLVDREDDLAAGEHNYLRYFADEGEAANRIGLLADRARAATAQLRHRRMHRAILTGVAGFYLSAPAADGGYARPIRGRLLESLDPTVRLIIAAMRLRRHG